MTIICFENRCFIKRLNRYVLVTALWLQDKLKLLPNGIRYGWRFTEQFSFLTEIISAPNHEHSRANKILQCIGAKLLSATGSTFVLIGLRKECCKAVARASLD